MDPTDSGSWIVTLVEWTAIGFALLLARALVAVAVMHVLDVTRTRHEVRRNYPVIGRFRYLFEHLSEFSRRYFFAMDREAVPFNRSQRSWAYRAAKNGVGDGGSVVLDALYPHHRMQMEGIDRS